MSIKSIEYYVEEILSKALNKGTVLIITNSSEGWVEYCVYSYYKNLIPLLKQINIISARTLYEQEFPSEPLTWKIKTFNDLTEKFNFEKCLLTNIICIGDDNSEIIAAKKLANNFENCLVKTIKLRESPKLKELIKQLILINEQILRVYSDPRNIANFTFEFSLIIKELFSYELKSYSLNARVTTEISSDLYSLENIEDLISKNISSIFSITLISFKKLNSIHKNITATTRSFNIIKNLLLYNLFIIKVNKNKINIELAPIFLRKNSYHIFFINVNKYFIFFF